MRRAVVNMKNFFFSDAIDQALRAGSDYQTLTVEKPPDVAAACRDMMANALLMEVLEHSPYTLEERLGITAQVKSQSPGCKVVLLVDENTDRRLAERVKEAKKSGLIDQFFYGSISASYLVALMDTL